MKEKSKHFTLEPLAEGVYAAIAIDGGAAICNAGLIDLGGQVVVYDTFLTPQSASDLLEASLDLFGRKPDLVINSHYHNDHTWGNQAFLPGAHILATDRTHDLFQTEGKEELKYHQENAARQLEIQWEKYQQAQDDDQRLHAVMFTGYYQGLVEALPTLRMCPADMTFKNHLVLHGTRMEAELIPFEKAHTQNDLVLFLREQKILFLSDLLFVGFHPYLMDGDVHGLLAALEEIRQWGAEVFIPGHGSVGTAEELHLLIEYLEAALETARELYRAGGGYEEKLKDLKAGGKFADWKLTSVYPANIRFLCQGMEAGEKQEDK